jgi:hypothetical protein
MQTIYINLLQTPAGIVFDASKVLKSSHPNLGRYIATYAIKGEWRSDIRPNVIGRIMHRVVTEEGSASKARGIAEQTLARFRVNNPKAMDLSSCLDGEWNATTSIINLGLAA